MSYKKPYYKKLKEFRQTDIRYIGSGGFVTARKEFGKDVDKKLIDNIWNIPKKDQIYLEYVDEKYKNEKARSKMDKEKRKELISKYPAIYKNYKDALLRLKYSYEKKGLIIKPIPKVWPDYIIKQVEERLKRQQQGQQKESKAEEPDYKEITIKDFEFVNPSINLDLLKPISQIEEDKVASELPNYKFSNLGVLKRTEYFRIGKKALRVVMHSKNTRYNYYQIKYKSGETVPIYRYDEQNEATTTTNFYNILKWLNDKKAVKITYLDYLQR